MSVDYNGVSGIGFRIGITSDLQEIIDKEFDGDVYEYLEQTIRTDKYPCSFKSYGNFYSGDIGYCIVLSETVKLDNLLEAVNNLRDYLIESQFDLGNYKDKELLRIGDVLIKEYCVS